MKKILMTGGGSAGHVIPNLALLPKLKEHYVVSYAGTHAIEYSLLKDKGIAFYSFSAPKLVRGSIRQNLTLPCRFFKSIRQAKQILKTVRPDLVFSKGGYVSLPVVLAAKKLNIPVLSHESDYSAGLANKIIAKRCQLVLTSFPETAENLPNGKYSGSPVREELFGADPAKARQKYGFSGTKPVLLVFGGGSGSAAINHSLEQCLPTVLNTFDVLHIRGKNENSPQFPGYVSKDFEQDMASAYACADYVLSRSGSNTVFEILALKNVPCLCLWTTDAPAATRWKMHVILQNADCATSCKKKIFRRKLCKMLLKNLPMITICPYALPAPRSRTATASFSQKS